MKKKLFISQPMKDKSYEYILSERSDVVKMLECLGYEIVNSVPEDYYKSDVKNKSLYYLSRSLRLMSECDCVYFMNGWEEARGCKLEHDAALAYGVEIV